MTDYSIPPIFRSDCSYQNITESTKEMLISCWRSFPLFCKTFFPSRFRDIRGNPAQPFAETHRKVNGFIQDCIEEQRTRQAQGKPCGFKAVVIAARGVSKSSHLQYALPAYRIFFGESSFISPICHSHADVLLHTTPIRQAFRTNKLIQYYAGDVTMAQTEGIEKEYGKESFVINIGPKRSLVRPLGRGMAATGHIFDDQRLDTIICDDMQQKKFLKNETLRDEDWEWLLTDVFMSVQQMESENQPWQIWLSDVAKHPDTVCERAMNEEGWHKLRIPLITESDDSLDEDIISTETVKAEAARQRAAGTYGPWASERRAIYVLGDEAPFKKEHFRYYEGSKERLSDRSSTYTVVIVDPAKTKNPRSAYTGMVVWNIDPSTPRLSLEAAFNERLSVPEQTELAASLCIRFNAVALGLEITGLSEFAQPPYVQELFRRGLFHLKFEKFDAKAGKGEFKGDDDSKDGRLQPLSGFYNWGIVYHNTEQTTIQLQCTKLVVNSALRTYENQLLAFSASTYRDVSDAAAYVLPMIERLKVPFFNPAMAARLASPEQGIQQAKSRFNMSPEDLLTSWQEVDMAPPLEFEPVTSFYALGGSYIGCE